MNMGQVFPGGHLGISHKQKVSSAQQIDQVVPLLDICIHIGRIAAVGLLKQREGAVGADGQRPYQLLEILAILLAVAEGDGML